jgi:ATP-dependent Clp protease ATP-binding subunit ClpA
MGSPQPEEPHSAKVVINREAHNGVAKALAPPSRSDSGLTFRPNEVRSIALTPEAVGNVARLLPSNIKGQGTAIDMLIRALRRRCSGVSDSRQPISFLLVGPTGVGKTELAKLTAQGLGRTVERFDIGQLGKEGQHSGSQGAAWTLFGSPQGFIGGEGMLTSAVAANPNAVVLLDEIEKGNPELLDLFLAILDEGLAKDNKTNAVIDFSQTIIFFTSNLITEIPLEVQRNPSRARNLVLATAFLKPEMINRINHVVPLKSLDDEALRSIANDELQRFLTNAKAVGPAAQKRVGQSVIDLVLTRSDTKYGARDVKRVVDEIVGDPLSDALIFRGNRFPVKQVAVTARNGRIEVEVA